MKAIGFSMTSIVRNSILALGAAVLLAAPGCGPENRSAPTVPLALRPGDTVTGVLGGPGRPAVVRVEPFVDERGRKDAIGENVEDRARPLPVHSSGQEPAEFVRQALIQTLRNGGFEVTDNAPGATRVISGRLTQFWVVEGGTYNATVNAVLEVKDAGGQSLWSGPGGGVDGTWGHSLSVNNYQQVISAATVKMLNTFFGEPAFRGALRVQ
jgi:hypothetical protein